MALFELPVRLRLLRFALWIVVAVLAAANWLLKEHGLGDYWRLAMAGLVLALVALAAWTLSGWKNGRDAGRGFEILSSEEPPEWK